MTMHPLPARLWPERALRLLFLAEFVFLALPSFPVLGTMAGALGYAGLAGLTLPFTLSDGRSLPGGQLTGALAIMAVAFFLSLCGFYAMARFLGAAIAYLRHGATGLTRAQARALPWAIPPLALTLPIGLPALLSAESEFRLWAVYLSGLGLLVPGLHLWLAWRGARRAATDRDLAGAGLGEGQGNEFP